MSEKKPVWIAGIARGHNAGVCLLKDGEVVFSVEEERLSRHKYDGGPLASMVKILDYTDKLDYLVVAHTQSLKETAPKTDYTGDDIYTGLARKLGLINRKDNPYEHSQVIDMSFVHHKLHAALAFYRSGFEKATAVVVDGAGTFIPLNFNGEMIMGWETETIFSCDYPGNFKTLWKHIGVQQPSVHLVNPNFDSSMVLLKFMKRLQSTAALLALKQEKLWDCFHTVKRMIRFRRCLMTLVNTQLQIDI